jgi:hypothetical protein
VLKRKYPAFQNMKNFYSFYICGSFLPSWIRIRIQQFKLMRIHADPDPQPWAPVSVSRFAIRIRIQKGKNIPERKKRVHTIHLLKCRMFSFEG